MSEKRNLRTIINIAIGLGEEFDGESIMRRYMHGFNTARDDRKLEGQALDALSALGWSDLNNGVNPPDEYRCGACGALLEVDQRQSRHCGCTYT